MVLKIILTSLIVSILSIILSRLSITRSIVSITVGIISIIIHGSSPLSNKQRKPGHANHVLKTTTVQSASS